MQETPKCTPPAESFASIPDSSTPKTFLTSPLKICSKHLKLRPKTEHLIFLPEFTPPSASPGLPRWRSGKESTCQRRRCKRCGFHPWVRKIRWRRIQCSCLENLMDGGVWRATFYGVTESRTQLSHGACVHAASLSQPMATVLPVPPALNAGVSSSSSLKCW